MSTKEPFCTSVNQLVPSSSTPFNQLPYLPCRHVFYLFSLQGFYLNTILAEAHSQTEKFTWNKNESHRTLPLTGHG